MSFASTAADGTEQVATVLFGWDGRSLATDGGASFTLDVPSGSHDAPSAAAFAWGNELYLAGASYPGDYATGDAFLARVNFEGDLDEGFAGGIVTQRQRLEYAAFNDIAVSLQHITAVGWDFGEQPATLPPSDVLLARYRKDGTLDATFGAGGVVVHDFHADAAVCGPRMHVE